MKKIPVGQILHHINVNNETPYNVMGGLRDNGSWHEGPAYTLDECRIKKLLLGKCWRWRWFDVMPDPEDFKLGILHEPGRVGECNITTGEKMAKLGLQRFLIRLTKTDFVLTGILQLHGMRLIKNDLLWK
jgi:hypothetical protein